MSCHELYSGTKIQPKEEVFGRTKTSVRPSKSWKKQAFRNGHPTQTSMKKLRSEKLRLIFRSLFTGSEKGSLSRVLRRGSKKGLSRRHLEGRNTPFREHDPLRVCPAVGQKAHFRCVQLAGCFGNVILANSELINLTAIYRLRKKQPLAAINGH